MNRVTMCAGAAVLALGACASPYPYQTTYYADPPPRYYAPRLESGTVERIEVMRHDGGPPVSVGALLGGVAGGIIGHQIGSGRGNTAATIAGAIGGALIGNEVERQNRVEGDRYRVTVRLDSGALVAIEQRDSLALRVGDRVRVENDRVHLM
jgi:outer membrane lipoprotein SlyB